MIEKLQPLITFFTPIISALLIWYIQHCHAEYDKRRDLDLEEERRLQREFNKLVEDKALKRADARRTENLLTMQMIRAVGKLAYANAVAVKDGRVNGVMGEAMDYYTKTNSEFSRFLDQQAVDNYSSPS